ncbi:hypothetical protein DY000_02048172 [Brassica cretica]|uniref:Uncharacterized protein n=1 Tax=Brassica cretica TaxID=69181 RepID=A0ABQ7ES71_BRACR|nr:hypothetical protein DY000_02048172 [Brassica cretica]
MSDTHSHEEDISADTYATLMRHQFNLKSLEDRLQKMETTTATMKEKWRRGDEAMRDFTAQLCLSWGLVYMRSDSSNKSGRHHSVPIDDNPKNSHSMKSQPDFHTIAEIDQLVEGIYRTMETTEERLDRRCDDIYFPMDLSMSALTSKIETIQWELVEIQSYISRRPEASAPIDRRNNKSTDIHRQTSVDEATNRGRLVPKVTSDMSDTHNHGEEI